jgi:hypothetical protein
MEEKLTRSNRGIVAVIGAACAVHFACSGSQAGPPATIPEPRAQQVPDTTTMIPAGFGALRQEDISLSLTTNGLTIRAIPTDEDVIRTLAPDSYFSIHNLREARRAALDTIARRTGQSRLSVWQFQFFNQQQGEAPFSPRDVIITTQGREFKPIDVIGITPGFGEGRVKQGQIQTGLLVFDGAINPNQPLTLVVGTQSNARWDAVLRRVEGERARVRSRAAGKSGRDTLSR